MTDTPLVSVITPAWQRHGMLLNRCIPSVQAQTWPRVEHMIISDGPDPELSALLTPRTDPVAAQDIRQDRTVPVWYRELPDHDPAEHWGSAARLAGIEYAAGDLIAYCDDDDAFRPEHCALLARALIRNPQAGFALSRMVQHGGAHDIVVGFGPLAAGNVGSPMIMHRRDVLAFGTWGEPSWIEDWMLVQRWLAMGVKFASVNAETVDVWPSVYRTLREQ